MRIWKAFPRFVYCAHYQTCWCGVEYTDQDNVAPTLCPIHGHLYQEQLDAEQTVGKNQAIRFNDHPAFRPYHKYSTIQLCP